MKHLGRDGTLRPMRITNARTGFAKLAYASLTALLAAIVACGTDAASVPSTGSATASGTVHGIVTGAGTVDPHDAIAWTIDQSLWIEISNSAGACPRAQRNAMKTGDVLLIIGVTAKLGSKVTAGTYDVDFPANKEGKASASARQSQSTDSKCLTDEADSVKGQVTIDSIDGAKVAGHFKISFGGSDEVSGTFNAGICAVEGGAPKTPSCE